MKEILINLFKKKGILNKNNGRKFCYKNYWDDECESLWKKYSSNYRSEDEAWYCLSKNVEPSKCPLCDNLCRFVGGKRGYKITCEICSPNKVPSKIEKYLDTISKKTDEEKRQSFEKRKQTNLKLYGDENYTLYGSESFKKNLLEKYGDEHYSNYEKAKETNIERYGVDCNFRKEGFQEYSVNKKRELYGNASNYEKTMETNIKRYGVPHISQCKEIINKSNFEKQEKYDKFELENNCTSRSKLKKQYGSGWWSLGIEYIEYMGHYFVPNEFLKDIIKYSNEGTHTNNYISKREVEFRNYIKEIYDGEILNNVTNVVKNNNHRYFELDLYLPQLKIAFDFDGVYWHSVKFKDKYYHQRKSICCLQQGVRLAHIQEDEWVNNKEELCNKVKQLIFENKIFNDGCFPPSLTDYNFSEPRKIMIDKFGRKTLDENQCDLIYYDTGVIL